ncbi:MAG: SagB/ThcOx family dehydrogenase [Candidatus Omnitrophota bacterium]|nr:MAG: SagB/ThcOx family dehydrogenase [Candidatus Omnitrophota bacterium]
MRYLFTVILLGFALGVPSAEAQELETMEKNISLPVPRLEGEISLEEAIVQRRSKRSFRPQELTLAQIGQLLWSAQGITETESGYRAAPSAGARYPMEIYIVKSDGLFHYLPRGHKLEQLLPKDMRSQLAAACLGQGFVAQAPVSIVIAAVYERITSHYGSRGERYTDIEVGHIAQNVHLQAVALGLGSVPVGAFDDQAVKAVLQLPDKEQPLYVIPIGYPR